MGVSTTQCRTSTTSCRSRQGMHGEFSPLRSFACRSDWKPQKMDLSKCFENRECFEPGCGMGSHSQLRTRPRARGERTPVPLPARIPPPAAPWAWAAFGVTRPWSLSSLTCCAVGRPRVRIPLSDSRALSGRRSCATGSVWIGPRAHAVSNRAGLLRGIRTRGSGVARCHTEGRYLRHLVRDHRPCVDRPNPRSPTRSEGRLAHRTPRAACGETLRPARPRSSPPLRIAPAPGLPRCGRDLCAPRSSEPSARRQPPRSAITDGHHSPPAGRERS